MMSSLLDSETTIAVIFGASDWSRARLGKAKSFLKSAAYVQQYFLRDRPDGLGLDPDLVLNLFDDTAAASVQLARLRDFTREVVLDRRDTLKPIADILVYYIGHGTCDDGNTLHLLVRDTVQGIEAQSSISTPDLARVLKVAAPQQRRLCIFDCCFSETAVEAFGAMGGLDEAVTKIGASNLVADTPSPQRGTMLLCSSPRGSTSIGLPNAERTLFTGALLRVLQRGSESRQAMLSFSDLKEDIFEIMLQEHNGVSVPRPALHQPHQQDGDLTNLPAFPNVHVLKKRAEEARRQNEERQAVEAKRQEEEQLLTEAKRIEEEQLAVEAKRQQEELLLTKAKCLEEERRAVEAKRQEDQLQAEKRFDEDLQAAKRQEEELQAAKRKEEKLQAAKSFEEHLRAAKRQEEELQAAKRREEKLQAAKSFEEDLRAAKRQEEELQAAKRREEKLQAAKLFDEAPSDSQPNRATSKQLEARLWRMTSAEDTIEAYKSYLEDGRLSVHATEAIERIKELKEAEKRERHEQTGSPGQSPPPNAETVGSAFRNLAQSRPEDIEPQTPLPEEDGVSERRKASHHPVNVRQPVSLLKKIGAGALVVAILTGVFALSQDKERLAIPPAALSSGVTPDALSPAPVNTTAVGASATSTDVATQVTKNPIPVAAGKAIENAKANSIPQPKAVAADKAAEEAKEKQDVAAKRAAKASAFRKRFQWSGKFYKGYALVLDGEKFRILSIDGNECEIGDVGYFENGDWYYQCKLNNVAYTYTSKK